MLLRLPRSLHYPVTVTKVLKQVGSLVSKDEPIFLYSYETTVREGSRDGDDRYVKKLFPATFDSGLEGQLKFWKIKQGDVLAQPLDVAEIEEDCAHAEQFAGMCTNCGKDMTIVSSFNNDASDIDRAPLQTSHDTQMLKISQREASRREEEAKRRLLASRKLSLVVDLDQTIIHAAVDPTIAEWQKDKQNPNHDVVKDVRAFQLIDDTPGMRGCWYYIKLRPGLADFLDQITQLYELHIYTMGTRQYAEQVANIVDPDRRLFGDRILSRDESGSATNKNLERLFPIDTKMVVIIDDRGDVWKWNANLIRVIPFDFFVGIGDINSSFLPKREDITPSPTVTEDAKVPTIDTPSQPVKVPVESVENGASSAVEGTDTSALEQLVAMGGGDDPVVRESQSKGQEETIAAQLEEKPLLQMQKLLDAKDEAEAATTVAETIKSEAEAEAEAEVPETSASINGRGHEPNDESESSSSSGEVAETTPTPKPGPVRHSLLRDDDRELIALVSRLTAVHTAFYHEYDRRRLGHKGGRVAALSGKRKVPLQQTDSISPSDDTAASDLLLVPDVKAVMPAIKHRVLSSVVIVLSGVLPLGSNVHVADISLWAKTFGAVMVEKVSKKTTHVVATRSGTSKVKLAIKRGLWVVKLQWLVDCMTGWTRLKEDDYVLPDLPSGMKGESKVHDGSDENGEELVDGDKRDSFDDDPRNLFLSSDDETTGLDTEVETNGNKIDNISKTSRKRSAGGDADSGKRNAAADADSRKRLRLSTPASHNNESETTTANIDGNTKVDVGTNGFFEDASPLSLNQDQWEDMDKELKEFMGSSGSGSGSSSGSDDDDNDDDDDGDDIDVNKPESDSESNRASTTDTDKRRNKRKRWREGDADQEQNGATAGLDETPPSTNPTNTDNTDPNHQHPTTSTSTTTTRLTTPPSPPSLSKPDNANPPTITQSTPETADVIREREEGRGVDEVSSDDELARELDREFDRSLSGD